ncbi:MAG: ribonuclease HII [Clostridia bacterium]|nr:ribonuclease HII [Clostridia bacterium]
MSMYTFETMLREKGCMAVCGIDEAGCGPLAGPVYAAAVILDPRDPIEGVDDSKKLSEKKREALYDQITRRARAWAVASASAEEIDQINILQARLLAMRRAVERLNTVPDYALVDGNRDPAIPDIPTLLIVGGDGKSASIGAASILAKVTRDRRMLELDAQYPQYQFARHKGYPTKLHVEKLLEYGPCPEHRQSFLKKIWERNGR